MNDCIILDWRDTFKFQAQPTYSIVAPTAGSLLSLSPPIALGLGIILLFGLGSIAAAQLEKRLAKRESPLTELVAPITIGILLASAFIGFFYLILHNPLWRL